jgi:hypothetical protein
LRAERESREGEDGERDQEFFHKLFFSKVCGSKEKRNLWVRLYGRYNFLRDNVGQDESGSHQQARC